LFIKKRLPYILPKNPLQLSLNQSLKLLLNGIHVSLGGDPRSTVGTSARKSEVLGHDTVVDGVDTGLLESLGELDELGGVVELSTLDKTTGPGEDGSNGVGGGLLTSLVLAPVAGDGSVGCGESVNARLTQDIKVTHRPQTRRSFRRG
jgi:hypothetical protein